MPPKKKDKKSENSGNIGKYYKPKKRKVISPIQVSENNSKSSSNKRADKKKTKAASGQVNKELGRCVSPEIIQEPKRFHQDFPSFNNFYPYANTDINSIDMNFQQMPFGQVMQSPPAFNQSFPALKMFVSNTCRKSVWRSFNGT